MEPEQVFPKSYPVNLIDKDWSKRKLYLLRPAKTFPDVVHNMKVREDDVWVVTEPKCGTTWMQELLWLLMNDCDFGAALATDLDKRSPFLEFDFLVHGDEKRALKRVEDFPSPRLIKAHLPLALLPAQLWQKKAKVVYVFRNPIDAWVSSYYHGVTLGIFYGRTLEDYFQDYVENKATKWDPITNAAEYYQLRNEPWIYYTSFEQMKKNLRKVIEDLCKFLDKTVTEQQMERLLKHLSFEEMKKNPTTNHTWAMAQAKHPNAGKEVHNFIRKGMVNGYKEELKPELIEKANRLIAEKLKENNVTLEELILL